MSADSRKEMASGLWRDPEYRLKVGSALKTRWADPEYKAMMSAKRKAYWERKRAEGWTMSEDHKAKLRGRKRSDETRAKMSASAKLRGPRPEVSEETRAKLSARAKAAWQDKELTARRIEAMRAAKLKETEDAA